MNPAIISTLSGTYIVDGGSWVPVPVETTMSQAQEIHKKANPDFYKPKPKPTSDTPRTVQVKSLTSNKIYQVVIFPTGTKVCDCVGYSYRRTCKHIQGVK